MKVVVKKRIILPHCLLMCKEKWVCCAPGLGACSCWGTWGAGSAWFCPPLLAVALEGWGKPVVLGHGDQAWWLPLAEAASGAAVFAAIDGLSR